LLAHSVKIIIIRCPCTKMCKDILFYMGQQLYKAKINASKFNKNEKGV